MFLDYSELLNALDSGAAAKITLNNRRINKEEFEASLLLPMKEDVLDEYRKEYNEMLLSKVSGTNNSIYQERYLTVSVHKKNIDEARTYFARVGTDIITHLSKLSSIGEELDAEQRLQIFRDFFRAEEPQCFPFDMKAVSYTHLRAQIIRRAEGELVFRHIQRITFRRQSGSKADHQAVIPVSYTHLDVYKRQRQRFRPWAAQTRGRW